MSQTKMTFETYRLTFGHYALIDGERIQMEEPLIVEMAFDNTYAPATVSINSMLERMCYELKQRVLKGAQE